jgi:hypothetical protein
MLVTTMTTEATIQPVTYRLPKPGTTDRFFGMSRAWYYAADKRLAERGERLLIHSCAPGKTRGVTLICYSVMAAHVKSLMEAQDGEAK